MRIIRDHEKKFILVTRIEPEVFEPLFLDISSFCELYHNIIKQDKRLKK